ncbi:Histidine kinase-, DNA gyrase B-, and HSP90-like ATPase [Reichenbachiella faecimaris]|uniref:histidine kinase n=2 Tax=Reichenbachiella faecimaris TaxID=692418 RepID=A0A1W2GR92_REIFA|nr:Histidine kinase-, DNA gyrase B-, and HSP90-like ATPase [Reichenbachiella faecimaris]
MDLLHVKSAAILSVGDSGLQIERFLLKGKVKSRDGVGQLIHTSFEMKEPSLIASSVFEGTDVTAVVDGANYYAFPCLDSHARMIALILLPVIDLKEFKAENYSLVHVVGQRLSVELEKSRVIKERESLSEFNASILESLDEVTWDYSITKKKIQWFGAIYKVFGFQKEELGNTIDFFLSKVHPSDRVILEDKLIMNKQSDEKFLVDFQFENLKGGFNWLRIEGVMHLDKSGNAERVIGVVKNVHNEKMAEMLRIRAMIKAKDSERKRIASEIHDSLGQTLSVARLELDSLSEIYKDNVFLEKVKSVSGLIAGAIQESRAISHDLMPPALVDYGLIPALETMISQLDRSSSVNFSFFHNEIEERFEEDFETNVYRICQEGVNNILKHAQAKNATVQVIRHPNYVYVSIEDDGLGFAQKGDSENASGLGLKNMANRVAYLGGKIDFETNNGSIITIEISI